MKKSALLLLFVFAACTTWAQVAREEIFADAHRSAANYYAYPTPNAKLTPAPKGYEPVYISAYARHGSRWLIHPEQYTKPLQILKKAAAAGMLTPAGQQALVAVDSVYHMANKRFGELTEKGARQHRGIAQRMYKNFPTVFADGAVVDARSTVVIRCILSMANECLQLQAENPRLRIKTDASDHDMYYLNDEDQPAIQRFRHSDAIKAALTKAWEENVKTDHLMGVLFRDAAYVRDSVDVASFANNFFSVAANMQSCDTKLDLYRFFTPEECYGIWKYRNLEWSIRYGDNSLSKGVMPYLQNNLLRNFLTTADSCLQKSIPGATLRFGHDVVVLPLACLMELGDCGKQQGGDANLLAEKWRNYEIFPMACNIQWVFYRKKKSKDLLVKVLLNEHEMSLPVATTQAPYYRWEDVRKYYQEKLSRFQIPTEK